MPPFSVVCFNCAPKDLEFLREHKDLHSQKKFWWSLKIKIRDGHKCRICVALDEQLPTNQERHKDNQAHHIFPIDLFPELEFIIDNGITLCSIHHNTLHRKQFEKIKKIILNSNELKK